MVGLTSFFVLVHVLKALPGYPVSDRNLTWDQRRRCGTGSNAQDQTEISALLDFGSQTFLFPLIKSQNCSEVRKAFSNQNPFKKHSPVTTPVGRKQ